MATAVQSGIPALNQSWPEQGGIYIGTRLVDGIAHHVVIPGGVEHDIKDVEFNSLAKSIPSEINGKTDWRAPDQEDLMLAYINGREHFKKEYYWSRSEHHGWPWAVDFENGITTSRSRINEFRVRPFRRFIY